jgi:hypothetical protein
MANAINVTDWHRDAKRSGTENRYASGYFIGSNNRDGEHLRSPMGGWPFSIYIKAAQPGVTDIVVCNGIQDIEDAHRIVYMLNQLYTYGDSK